MGNTGSNDSMKADGDITSTRRHRHRNTKHRNTRHRNTNRHRRGKRSHFGRRTRRYKGGEPSPSPLRKVNQPGSPASGKQVLGSRNSGRPTESPLSKSVLTRNAIKAQAKADAAEKERERQEKDRKEGFDSPTRKLGSRFSVSEKNKKKPPPILEEEEESI